MHCARATRSCCTASGAISRAPAESHDFVVVTDYPKDEQRPAKIWWAAAFFALAMGLGLFTDLKLSVAMLVGAVGMLLTGVLNMDEAYGAINWKTIFTLACLIPLGWAMDSTGAAAWIAQEVLRYLGEWPQWGLQAVIAILALLFSQVVSNVGATVMMVPMAINVALASGGNPAVYALLVAISTSNTFVIASANPVHHDRRRPRRLSLARFPARRVAVDVVDADRPPGVG